MIEVGRNSIVIRNIDLNSKGFKKFNYYFSLYDKVQHKYTFSVYSLINNDIYIPASVGIDIIRSFFPKEEVIYNNNFPKAESVSYTMKHPPKNKLQTLALEFLLKMRRDTTNKSRFLSLKTGSGKTYITINLISQLKRRPMIIVDTIDLADQWKQQFLKHTDLSEDDIEIISGQDSVNKAIKNHNSKVYICIHRTLSNMLIEDVNSINNLMNKLKIGFRIFDESHVEFGNICKINSLSNIEYTLYLTATPSRSAYSDNTLYGRVFKLIPFFNGSQLGIEKYHTVVIYQMDSKPGIDERLSVKTKYGFNAARWAKYIAENGYEFFIAAVEEIFEKFSLLTRNKKIVIMLPTIELIKKLKESFKEAHSEVSVGTFIGEINVKKRSQEWDDNLVVLTDEKIFGKAIDKDDCEIIINFVPVGSQVKVEQMIGRLRGGEGKLAILIDVVDYGFDECIKQFKLRKRFYKKKAKKIIDITRKENKN